ncbi:hypothetical protein PG984_010305 [Apiospora sp. TS-2023a]
MTLTLVSLGPSKSDPGLVQVTTREEHVTDLETGFDSVDEYLYGDDAGDGRHSFARGELLFRSAFIGQSLVATMHHAIADYWSMDKLLRLDLPVVYFGRPPIRRPAFRDFVAQCLRIDRAAANGFWASRFKGIPAIFPPNQSSGRLGGGVVSEKPSRMMPLRRSAAGPDSISPSHMAWYIEAAWALTAAIYTDSGSVAYGYVLSGRSPNPDPEAVENTLGPTLTEIPVQVSMRPAATTVDKLIKDRAASWRHLQQNASVLQYGLASIAAVSEAAKAAAGFQALINIRPSVFTQDNRGTSVQGPDSSQLRMVWRRGHFPLQLIFSITEEGVMVWPRTNPAVVGDGWLSRILHQYQHILRLLTEAPPQTKLGHLPLLDPQARSVLVLRNDRALLVSGAAEQCLRRGPFSGPALARAFRAWDLTADGDQEELPFNTLPTVDTPAGCGIIIGRLRLIGRVSNRVRFGGQTLQLEELESAMAGCDEVRDVVAATRIAGGRTRLVAVLCLADAALPRETVLGRLPPPPSADSSSSTRACVEVGVQAARQWM